jgi:arylsulfatase B
MRQAYERWWERVEPGARRLERIGMGGEMDRVRLSHIDWRGDSELWYQGQIRTTRGYDGQEVAANGVWSLHVEDEGMYDVELRRWPEEADVSITQPAPEYTPVDTTFLAAPRPEDPATVWAWIAGSYPEGRALPVSQARLQINDVDLSCPVGPGDRAARFTLHLPRGDATLRTWFYDECGQHLCGAFYVHLARRR